MIAAIAAVIYGARRYPDMAPGALLLLIVLVPFTVGEWDSTPREIIECLWGGAVSIGTIVGIKFLIASPFFIGAFVWMYFEFGDPGWGAIIIGWGGIIAAGTIYEKIKRRRATRHK